MGRNIAEERKLFKSVVDELNKRYPCSPKAGFKHFLGHYDPKYIEWTLYCSDPWLIREQKTLNWIHIHQRRTGVVFKLSQIHPVTVTILRNRNDNRLYESV